MRAAITVLWIGSLCAVLVQAGLAFADLPEVIASHTDGRGTVDGWMRKGPFFALWAGLILVTNVVVSIPGLTIDRWPHLLSVPYRDHWLKTPHRRVTLRRVLWTTLCGTTTFGNVVLFVVLSTIIRGTAGLQAPLPVAVLVGATLGILLFGIGYPVWALRPGNRDATRD